MASSTTSRSKVRIIGGQWRGRKLPVAQVDGLRPTGDRIRETLFNWLQGEIRDAHCLDMYAGTGALGLEALSRGASNVQFLEQNALAAKQLADNILLLNAQQACLARADALEWLKQTRNTPFRIVFIDPPFSENLWNKSIEALSNSQCLACNALIYIETPINTDISTPLHWQIQKQKTSGKVTYRLYQLANRARMANTPTGTLNPGDSK